MYCKSVRSKRGFWNKACDLFVKYLLKFLNMVECESVRASAAGEVKAFSN